MLNSRQIVLDTNITKKKPSTVGKVTGDVSCPFCEISTGKGDNVIIGRKNKIIWMENKFPMLKDAYQTVLVETDNCIDDLSTYSFEHAVDLFRFALEKRYELLSTGAYKEVLFFKNHGVLSDSSVHHAHMQLVGLKEHQWSTKEVKESLEGFEVHREDRVQVNVSATPLGEFYEFNVTWEKEDDSFKWVHWVQTIIRYIKTFKNGKMSDYNLAFYEIEGMRILKIIPRKPISVYFLGYGLKQTPNDMEQIANEIRKFEKEN